MPSTNAMCYPKLIHHHTIHIPHSNSCSWLWPCCRQLTSASIRLPSLLRLAAQIASGYPTYNKSNLKRARHLTGGNANKTSMPATVCLPPAPLDLTRVSAVQILKNQRCKSPNSISQATKSVQMPNMQQPQRYNAIAMHRWQELPYCCSWGAIGLIASSVAKFVRKTKNMS